MKSNVRVSVAEEVKVSTKQWTTWKVDTEIDHGAEVTKGTTLLSFQKDKFTNALEKKQRDIRLQELNLEKQKLAVKQIEFTAQKEI